MYVVVLWAQMCYQYFQMWWYLRLTDTLHVLYFLLETLINSVHYVQLVKHLYHYLKLVMFHNNHNTFHYPLTGIVLYLIYLQKVFFFLRQSTLQLSTPVYYFLLYNSYHYSFIINIYCFTLLRL